MKIKDLIFKYRKIIMLALVLVSVVIIITAMYVTEYNNNKVTREDVLTSTPSGIYKDSKDFTEQFDTFKIYLTSELEVMFDDNGEILEDGTRKFAIETKLKDSANIKKVAVTLGMGANWVKYISSTGSNSDIDLDDTDNITINGIDTLFPLQNDLWFTPKLQPTLYVLIEWTDTLNAKYHTYLQYDYSVYSVKPSTK